MVYFIPDQQIMESEMDTCELKLTPIDHQIAKGVCLGFTNKEICEQFRLSASKVKEGVAALTHKCNVANRTALAGYLMLTAQVKINAKEFHEHALKTAMCFVMSASCAIGSAGLSDDSFRTPPRPVVQRGARREILYV